MKIDKFKIQGALPIPIHYFETIDSTSLFAKKLVEHHTDAEFAVIAKAQTGGRGRTGKSFYSPAGTGLYVTFAFREQRFRSEHITPRVAIASARAIDRIFSVFCQVKWVNDLYINDRKIGGILCQHVGTHILIGIGINILMPTFIPEELVGRFGAITEKCDKSQYYKLLSDLYDELLDAINEDIKSIYTEFLSRCCHINEKIWIEENGILAEGVCLGINPDFSLSVKIGQKIRFFTSGYMTIRIEHR